MYLFLFFLLMSTLKIYKILKGKKMIQLTKDFLLTKPHRATIILHLLIVIKKKSLK